MSLAEVIPFKGNNLSDVPTVLRELADSIEQGKFGDAHNVVYVIDCGDSLIEVGMAGRDPAPAATAHFLLACGMKKLLSGVR